MRQTGLGLRTVMSTFALVMAGVISASHAQTSPATGASAPARRAEAPVVGTSRAGSEKAFEFQVRDIPYLRHGDTVLLGRLYQPKGRGPFPAVLEVHGGAWTSKDRTDGQNTALDLAGSGIVVFSIDFRDGRHARYPASLQDINYGIRWLKAHAHEFGSSADRVGIFGTSSGGHQAVLAAIRPDDPRYTNIPLNEAPRMDAKVAFLVSGWGVLWPVERLEVARRTGNTRLVQNHAAYFGPDPQTQVEASPGPAIERGEKVYLPPAFLFQGTADEWTSVDLAKRFAAAYRTAGGSAELQLLEGEEHTFVWEHPFTPNSIKAVQMMKDFILARGKGRGE